MVGLLKRFARDRCFMIASMMLLVGVCAGCGSRASVGQVQGKVTLDGSPLAAGAIATVPDAGRGAHGAIENGVFELGTFGENDGALIGTHKVAVVAYEQAKNAGPESPTGKLLVPQRYTNPETSGLTIEVKAGEVNTPTLNLTSQQ
jgi:hypothetical protein